MDNKNIDSSEGGKELAGVPSAEPKPSPELGDDPVSATRQETLEERSDRKHSESLARRDAAYISDEFDDFWA